jgi:metal-responsive CopG/Arc/MetJ family transcriptional regulator
MAVTVSVTLPDETIRDLEELAKQKGISRNEALVQAITTVKSLVDAHESGKEILLGNGKAFDALTLPKSQ